MAQHISQIQIAWRVRIGGGGRTERSYLDFIIDGQSIGEILQIGDMIGCLGWGTPEYEAETTQTLLLKRPSLLASGRVMLYVCPECGDIGCGALTVQVEKTTNDFVWRSFGYENDYDPTMPDLKQYQNIGPYYFAKSEYWRVLIQRPESFPALREGR